MMISPQYVCSIINRDRKNNFTFRVIDLETEIGTITKFRRIKFVILCKENKLKNLDEISSKLIVDINSFILHYKGKILPNYIYPLAFPIEIFDINSIKFKNIISQAKKDKTINYKQWENTFKAINGKRKKFIN